MEKYISSEQETIRENLQRLDQKIEVIVDVVKAQQSYAGLASLSEKYLLSDIINDAQTMLSDSMEQYHIKIETQLEDLPPVLIQRTKLIHILINLINNAKDAMINTPEEKRSLTILLEEKDNNAFIKIADSGEGIAEDNLKKIFTHGYTTKEGGHGFGLHSSANYMMELKGDIWAESEGLGKGATFVLKFTIKDM